MKIVESTIRKHPSTFEFLPSISRTSMSPYVIWILSFGTYSIEITILKEDSKNSNTQFSVG